MNQTPTLLKPKKAPKVERPQPQQLTANELQTLSEVVRNGLNRLNSTIPMVKSDIRTYWNLSNVEDKEGTQVFFKELNAARDCLQDLQKMEKKFAKIQTKLKALAKYQAGI